MSRKSVPTGFSSSRIVSIGVPSVAECPASATKSAPLSTSTTANLPLGNGPSARGDRAPAGGGSTSRTIAAAWLCAISCAKVSDTAEQNGQASTCRACPTSMPKPSMSRITRSTNEFLMTPSLAGNVVATHRRAVNGTGRA